MSTHQSSRKAHGDLGESDVEAVLVGNGYSVVNLNEHVGNCPFGDLIAERNGQRLLVQVKSTTTPEAKYGTPPHRARALQTIANAFGVDGVYAFVHLASQGNRTCFVPAADIESLATQAELEYAGVNRYHVDFAGLQPYKRPI